MPSLAMHRVLYTHRFRKHAFSSGSVLSLQRTCTRHATPHLSVVIARNVLQTVRLGLIDIASFIAIALPGAPDAHAEDNCRGDSQRLRIQP